MTSPHLTCLADIHYIPNFSGKAFELLIRYLLENFSLYKNTKLIKKLLLPDANFEVTTYWDSETQVDLIVEHKNDRISRIIECKWLNEKLGMSSTNIINELVTKKYTPPAGYTKKYFLISSQDTTPELESSAKEQGVNIITLSDLID